MDSPTSLSRVSIGSSSGSLTSSTITASASCFVDVASLGFAFPLEHPTSDSDKINEDRKITVSDYRNLNGLTEVTKMQDEGWDPVDLYIN